MILVEGRSDKAALTATARMLGVNFEAAGIAILSTEGKANLDRPYVIFRELGIPTFMLWDCDQQLPEAKRTPATDLALSKLAKPNDQIDAAPTSDLISDCYAHFERHWSTSSRRISRLKYTRRALLLPANPLVCIRATMRRRYRKSSIRHFSVLKNRATRARC